MKTGPSIGKRHPSSSHHQRTSQVCLPPGRVPNPVLAKQAPLPANFRWLVEHNSLRASLGAMVVTRKIVWNNEIDSVGQEYFGHDHLRQSAAVSDMCNELACRISDCSERTGELVAQDNSKNTVIPTELMTTNKSPRTDENVQGNLLLSKLEIFHIINN